MPIDPHDHASAAIPLPQLSDDAVVQIHDFIYDFLDLFESRYGDQIHRYYEDRSRAQHVGAPTRRHGRHPPF